MEESAGLIDREIERCALAKQTEIHVTAEISGILSGDGRAAEARGNADATQHEAHGYGEILERVGGFVQTGHPFFDVEMPASVRPVGLYLGAVVGSEGAAHQALVAHSPVAIQSQTLDADREDVAGHRTFHVERTGQRIPAKNAHHGVFVGAARIDAGGMDRIARPDMEHRFDRAGEFSLELARNEVMSLGCGRPLRSPARRPAASSLNSVWIGAGVLAGHAVARRMTVVNVDRAVRFLEFKAHIRGAESAVQGYVFSAIDRARKLALFDFQLHALSEVAAEDNRSQFPIGSWARGKLSESQAGSQDKVERNRCPECADATESRHGKP